MVKTDTSDTMHDRLVDAAYEGAMQDIPWETFLQLLRQALDAEVVSLTLRPPAEGDDGLILNHRRPRPGERPQTVLAPADDWPVSAYKERFYALDPFVNLPMGEVVTLDELVPPKQLLASEYYRQYLQPAGVFHILGSDVREPDGLVARLRAMRGPDEPPFSAAAKQLCARILPHLRRAIQVHARLNRMASERDIYAGAVSQLAVGTIILDEHGTVLKVNPPAEALLAERDGLSLRERRIQLATPAETAAFSQQLQRLLHPDGDSSPSLVEAARIRRPSGRPDLGVILRPVPKSEWAEGQQHPSVAVFISNPEQQTSTSREILARLFGFTPAEAALAMELARGLTLAEASTALNISQHTARAQLKSIFSRAGVTRQAELISLILKSVATLA